MIAIEDGNGMELTKVQAGEIAKPAKQLSVGELELALLARFPREDAEPWDRTGLLVGDPLAKVSGVAVALDATQAAIRAAAKAGANVLLTHHPAYLDPPETLSPSRDRATPAGVNAFTAAQLGLALMNFHTALDANLPATRLFPHMLSLDFERLLLPHEGDAEKGYGQLCIVRESDKPFTLARMAARCTSVFNRMPRVWGDMAAKVERVVVANGSAGGVVDACLLAHADCLVCGEIKYHAALDASQAGLAIVELGHDVSELPLVALLAQAAIDAGVAPDDVFILDQSANWSTPDATRI